MTIYDDVFPLGLGTNRLPTPTDCTEEEIGQAVDIVVQALNMGINYIDTAPSYSGGHASEVIRRALMQTKCCPRMTSKLTSRLKTECAARQAVESHMEMLGVSHISDVMVWSVFDYEEFEQLMRPGGIYDAARKMKDERICDHITVSVHAPTEDILKILKSDAFEGMMISMSALNAVIMEPVLDYAYEHGIGIAVMNPLGGGFIPQKQEQFQFLLGHSESNIVHAALRFLKAHPAIKLILAGAHSVRELKEDIEAFTEDTTEKGRDRWKRVSKHLTNMGDFCTGCHYCEPCPKGIRISFLMQAKNTRIFTPPEAYRCTDEEKLKDIQMFKRLNFDLGYIPENSENPCVHCGKCEQRCTQHLPIIDSIAKIYQKMEECGYSQEARRRRLDELLNGKDYKKVAIWPAGAAYAEFIVKTYLDYFGQPPFEFVYFNSSPALYGKTINGYQIHAPKELADINPDCVLIVSFTYGEEIYQDLIEKHRVKIDIAKLHQAGDVPWVY